MCLLFLGKLGKCECNIFMKRPVLTLFYFLDAWSGIDATEDWDNEEYTGSLADTKVFTPSTLTTEAAAAPEQPKCEELPSINPMRSAGLLEHNVSIDNINDRIIRLIMLMKCSLHTGVAKNIGCNCNCCTRNSNTRTVTAGYH